MATLTTNLSLTKPAGTDFYDISVQNANMDTLDTAVAGKADTVHVHPIYTTCATAAATKAKTAALSDFTLVTGAMVTVSFTNGNTNTSATLNVNATGAKTLRYDGANLTSTLITSGDVVVCVYDGTYWQVVSVGALDSQRVRMTTGSYIGTGTATTKTIYSDGFIPKFAYISQSGGWAVSQYNERPMRMGMYIYGMSSFYVEYLNNSWKSVDLNFSASSGYLSFSVNEYSLNVSGTSYYYVLIG